MPIHARVKDSPDEPDVDVYAAGLAVRSLPKRRLPEAGVPAAVAYALVRDELILDGNSRQNLATFCTTWMEPEVRQLMADSIDKNMIDKDEYPQTAEIESRCVHILADLWHSPDAGTAIGCSTTGSSEAAMLGGLALKWQWRKRRIAGRQAGRPAEPRVRPGAGLLGEVRPLLRRRAAPDSAPARRDRHDAGSARAPTATRTRSASCRRWASPSPAPTSRWRRSPRRSTPSKHEPDSTFRSTSTRASGGFIAPFVQPDLEWDFRLTRVKSINTSGHKYGMAPLGVGWVIWRDTRRAARGADLPRRLSRRRHADVRPELQPAGRRDHRAVLQLHPPRPRGLPRHPAGVRRHRAVPRRRGRGDGAVRAALRRQRRPAGDRLHAQGPAPAPASRSTTSPTACACAAGRSRRIRCRQTGSTPSCSAFSSATA